MSALPSEIAASLGERASGTSHVRIGAGLDSFLGETHLVVDRGALRVWARGSVLDPPSELADVKSAGIELGGLGAELLLRHAAGESRVRLGYSEKERVTALLASVAVAAASPAASPEAEVAPAAEAPRQPTPLAEATAQPAPAAEATAPEPRASEPRAPEPGVGEELVELRARLLGVLRGAHASASGRVAMLGTLCARNDAKRDVQLARLERKVSESIDAEVHAQARAQAKRDEEERSVRDAERRAREDAEEMQERAAQQAAQRAARKSASRAENRRKQQGGPRPSSKTDAPLTAHVGEAWMPTHARAVPSAPAAKPEAPEPPRSALPWVVLVVLLLAGALPALSKLLSTP